MTDPRSDDHDAPFAAPEAPRVLARLDPSPLRRLAGSGSLLMLAGFLLWLVFWHPPAQFSLRLFLLILSVAAMGLAVAMWQATRHGLILTERDLRDTAGEALARLDEIEEISRGALAFKPSQGFVLRLRTKGQRRWRPGLWWRFGRSLGVGGVTPRNEGRFMAESIAGLIKAGSADRQSR